MSRASVVLRRSRRGVHLLLVCALSAVLAVTMLAGTAPAADAATRLPAIRVQSQPLLTTGSRSTAVLWVQKRLGVRPLTGYFGPITRAAVKRFQTSRRIPATGVVASRTWRALGVRPARGASRSARRLTPGTAAFGRAVLRYAAAQRGKPYIWGGTGPRGFDCSGYTRWVYRQVGIVLPRVARAQRRATRRISTSKVRVGDLVFVHTRGRVTHVAIYAGRRFWWESPRPGRSILKRKAWSRRVSYGRA
jgi:cell wall-associated NlpC family hydrolase